MFDELRRREVDDQKVVNPFIDFIADVLAETSTNLGGAFDTGTDVVRDIGGKVAAGVSNPLLLGAATYPDPKYREQRTKAAEMFLRNADEFGDSLFGKPSLEDELGTSPKEQYKKTIFESGSENLAPFWEDFKENNPNEAELITDIGQDPSINIASSFMVTAPPTIASARRMFGSADIDMPDVDPNFTLARQKTQIGGKQTGEILPWFEAAMRVKDRNPDLAVEIEKQGLKADRHMRKRQMADQTHRPAGLPEEIAKMTGGMIQVNRIGNETELFYETPNEGVTFTDFGEWADNQRIGDVYQNEALFEIVPELRDFRIRTEELADSSGHFDAANKEIVLDTDTIEGYPDWSRGTLVHEVQHYLQNMFGMPSGSNRHMFSPVDPIGKKASKELPRTLSDVLWRADWDRRDPDEARKAIQQYIARNEHNMKYYENNYSSEGDKEKLEELNKALVTMDEAIKQGLDIREAGRHTLRKHQRAYDQYMGTHGEVGARVAKKRMNLTTEERADRSYRSDFDEESQHVDSDLLWIRDTMPMTPPWDGKMFSDKPEDNMFDPETSVVRSYYMDDWVERTGLDKATIEKFGVTGDNQRGAPEIAMRRLQDVQGSGVLNIAVEHIGDLSNRVSPMHNLLWGMEEANGKAERILKSLNSGYGFEREFRENLESNARYINIPLKEHRENVDQALKTYTDEHKKLEVHNKVQRLGRDAAIAVGEKRFDDAIGLLEEFIKVTSSEKSFIEALKTN